MANTNRDETLPLLGDTYDGKSMRQMVQVLQRFMEYEDYEGRRISTVLSSTYDTLGTDAIILVSYTATGIVTVNLPPASRFRGRSLTIFDKDDNASVNNITVQAAGSELILGANTYIINVDSKSIILTSDGEGWFIEAQS